MSEHYTRATVSAEAWCARCRRRTQHRVDDCRLGPCLDCVARLEEEHAASVRRAGAETSLSLFPDEVPA